MNWEINLVNHIQTKFYLNFYPRNKWIGSEGIQSKRKENNNIPHMFQRMEERHLHIK